MRLPGFEPGSPPWESGVIPLDHSRILFREKDVKNKNFTFSF